MYSWLHVEGRSAWAHVDLHAQVACLELGLTVPVCWHQNESVCVCTGGQLCICAHTADDMCVSLQIWTWPGAKRGTLHSLAVCLSDTGIFPPLKVRREISPDCCHPLETFPPF